MINTTFLHLVDSLHTAAEVSLPLARALGPEKKKRRLFQLQLIKTTIKYVAMHENSLFHKRNNSYNPDLKSWHVCQHMVVLFTSPFPPPGQC